MKNNSIALMWSLVGGISLLGMLGMLVSAADVTITIDSSNAIQHIESVTIEQENNPNNYVTMTRVGARLLKMQTNSNILLNENEISGTSTNSAILGGRENRIVRGGLSTIIAGIGNAITNEDEGGEGNVILGGEWNKIANSDLSTIAGGRGNFIEGRASTIVGGESNTISGDYSVIVGRENSVVGNNSVAMGVTSKINGNNSFLWTDSTREDELNADDVFVVVSEKGMVINSREPNPSAQLTVGGSIVMTMNDDDENVVCEGGQGAGTMKTVLTGDRYCLCSCDGEGRNSMFGQGECQSICDGNTQPVCGDDLYIVHSGSIYTFLGTCLSGNVVEGTGAYIVDKNDVVHWTCQIDNGEAVLCSGSNVIAMPSSCIFDGETIPHGGSVRGYSTSTPAGSCMEVSKMKVCNDGILSEPDYQYATCNNGCKKPWDNSYISHGSGVTAYRQSIVPFDVVCEDPQTRICNDGNLGGSYMYPSCISQEVQGCFYEGDGIKYDHLSLLVTYDIPDGQCPDNGCDGHALVSRCYNGNWLNGDDQYWKVVGSDPKDVELIWPDIESIKVKPYSHKKCESHDSPNASTYTLSACDTNGTCSSANVSIADNNVDPKVSLVPLCETKRMYKIDSCNAGYYKSGESCVKCPDGYTSAAGATSQNGCYITCNDKEYLATVGASSCTSCEDGRYSTGRQLSYGSTSTCGFCNNKPDNSHYTSNATTENGCSWTCNNGYTLSGGVCEMVSAPECGSAAGGSYTSAPSSNLCSVGNLVGSVSSNNSTYTWECTNGSTTVSCAAGRKYTCSGTTPSGNGVSKGASTYDYGGNPTSWTYKSNGDLGSCQWRCNNGYAQSGSSNSCLRTCTLGSNTYTQGQNAQGYIQSSAMCPNTCPSKVTATCQSDGTWSPNIYATCSLESQNANGYIYSSSSDCAGSCYTCSSTTRSVVNNNGTSCSNVTRYRRESCNNSCVICETNSASEYCMGDNNFCRPGASCSYHWGTLSHKSSTSLFSSQTPSPTCVSQTVTCYDGTLSPSGYIYDSCSTPPDPGSNTCFLAGTPVLTLDGYKNIEDIREGDMVLSYNEITDTIEYNPVLKHIVHEDSVDDIYTITVDDGNVIEPTDMHPFYVVGNKYPYQCTKGYTWVLAKYLEVGDKLMKSDGSLATIEAISHRSNRGVTYNLSVSNAHSYFVGEGYLVHNEVNVGGGGVNPIDPVDPTGTPVTPGVHAGFN